MSAAETQRPSYPDCAAWPMCGREVRGHCACTVDVATVPAPRPDPVAAVRRLRTERASHAGRIDALDDAIRSLVQGMTAAERARLGDATG